MNREISPVSPLVEDETRREPAREPGQIMILFAALLIVLMVLAGSAFDWGSLVVEDARLQNAVDSAALAGSIALSNSVIQPAPTAVAIAQATASEYLRLNGYTNGGDTTVAYSFPTSTPAPSSTPSPIQENMSITVTRNHPYIFWNLVGVNQGTLFGEASARAARGMTDVLLSLDLTGSMTAPDLSNNQGGRIPDVQEAVEAFVDQVGMHPTGADPRGTKVGVARFAGMKCLWDRNSPAPGDNDSSLDLSSSVSTNEYVGPCSKDMTLLSPLTFDPRPLKKLARNNPTSGTCPNGISTSIACPLKHVPYAALRVPGQGTGPPSGGSPYFTGTRITNGLDVVLSPYAWATANGGRNASPTDPVGSVWAKKVLVLMTDGQNEPYPLPGLPLSGGSASQWDTELRAAAALLKPGPNSAIPEDNVEIYTVGFFCTPYSSSTTAIPAKWCKSRVADTTAPHPCPGPVYPPPGITPSAIDDLLVEVSSSTPGTCDHYLPLRKDESLPLLFAQLAGKIARGQLTR